jgi:hypothetical protein
MYINGVRETNFSTETYPAPNAEASWNRAEQHNIGSLQPSYSNYFDGYLAEVHFLDGLTPGTTTRVVNGVTEEILTDFGEFDATTGVWNPIAYTGSYPGNSFYLDFADNSSTTSGSNVGIGKDVSGNGNYWDSTNISVWNGGTKMYSVGAFSNSLGYGFTTPGFLPAQSFDGSLTTFAGNNNGGGTNTWTAQSTITVTSSLRVYVATGAFPSGTTWSVNGVSQGSTSNGWLTATGISTPYTLSTVSNTLGSSSTGAFFAAIEVDGSILVDITNPGNDSLRDSPTNGDTANDTGLGGEIPGNYCTLNPLQTGSNTSLANGNLDFSNTATEWNTCLSTIFVSSGKWYCETVVSNAAATTLGWGIAKNSHGIDTYLGATADGWALYGNTTSSYTYTNGSTVNGSYCTLANNDVLGMALDMDAGTLTYYVNNVSQGTAFSGITGSVCFAVTAYPSGATSVFNFGQRAFAHSAPSGFKAVCTANLDDPLIADPSTVMDVATYPGTNTSQTITLPGAGFDPDFIWIKRRNASADHVLFDAVRGFGTGATKTLFSNTADVEVTTGIITSTTSTGFNLSGSGLETNQSGGTYVAWNWDAGTSNAENTSGTITSTVRANISAGFSIVSWTGTLTASTVGHGLGAVPELIIVKNRDETYDWGVYTKTTGNANTLFLDLDNSSTPASLFWNSTSPTSSVFSVGAHQATNNNGKKIIAYCFAPVEGYSAFGSYTGGGTNLPFIWTGFRPRWLLLKASTDSADWLVLDAERNTYNVLNSYLSPNTNLGEGTFTLVDFTSNGFKMRNSAQAANFSGTTYIYAAFAESPFKYARAR